jgi:hypothetical protein
MWLHFYYLMTSETGETRFLSDRNHGHASAGCVGGLAATRPCLATSGPAGGSCRLSHDLNAPPAERNVMDWIK